MVIHPLTHTYTYTREFVLLWVGVKKRENVRRGGKRERGKGKGKGKKEKGEKGGATRVC